MIVGVPAFTYPLDAGPATAELSFVVGAVRLNVATWVALQGEPRWVDVGDP